MEKLGANQWAHHDSLSTHDSVILRPNHPSRTALDRSVHAQADLAHLVFPSATALFDMIVARLCRMSQDEDLLQALMVTSLPARAATFLANAVHAHWPRRNILDPKLPYALWLALAAQNELPLQYSVYSGLSLADTTELKILHERHIWRNPDMAPFSFITVLDLQDPLLPISDQFINEIRPLLGRSLTALRVSHNSITNKSAMYLTSSEHDFRHLRILSLEGCRHVTPDFAKRMHHLPSLAVLDLRDTNCSPAPVIANLPSSFHLAKSAELNLIGTHTSLVTSLRSINTHHSASPSLPPAILINALDRTDCTPAHAKPKSNNSAYTSIHGRVSGTMRISADTLAEDAAIEGNKGAAFRTGRGESIASGGTSHKFNMRTNVLRKEETRLSSVEHEDVAEEMDEVEEGVSARMFHQLPTFKKVRVEERNQVGDAIFIRKVDPLVHGFSPGVAQVKQEEKKRAVKLAKPKVFGRPVAEPVKTRPKSSSQLRTASSLLDLTSAPAAKKPKLSNVLPSSDPASSLPSSAATSKFGSFGSSAVKAPMSSLSSRKNVSAFRRK